MHFDLSVNVLKKAGMQQGASFLRALENVVASGRVPTEDAIVAVLGIQIDNSELAREIVNRVASFRTLDGGVESIAFAIGTRMKEIILADALQRMADELINNATSSYPREFTEIMERLSHYAPIMRDGSVAPIGLAWHEFKQDAIETAKRLSEGRSYGPEFPWQAVNDLFPGVRPGEMTLITAKTGVGKTTFANEMAMHMASQGDYLVVLMHLETSRLTIAQRVACKMWAVKPSDFTNGSININDPVWSERFRKTGEWIEEQFGTGIESRLIYDHCPGLTKEEWEVKARKYRAQAESLGLELVIILDYFQEMTMEDGRGDYTNKTHILNELASSLKDSAEQLGIYLFVFAQEGENGEAVYGRNIRRRSQLVFSLRRGQDKEEASSDLPVVLIKDGKPAKNKHGKYMVVADGLNRPMLYHRAGDTDSLVRVVVTKANNARTGAEAFLRMANGYFSIVECDELGNPTEMPFANIQ
jgi:energy-coupling factor transporter ATP-binding protein EcfA2